MTQSLLESLIALPSVTPGDAGCIDFLRGILGREGFQTQVLESNGLQSLYACHGAGTPNICLSGHVDVVPPGPLDAWATEPFNPTVKDGVLYGRGAADMKSGVAAMVSAAIEFVRQNPGHLGTVSLLFTSDEEDSSRHGAPYCLARIEPKPTAALVGEPTSINHLGDEFKVGRRGSLNGFLTFKGRQGHTAYAHLAQNPVHEALPFLTELAAHHWDAGHGPFPPTTLQIANLQAGVGASNVTPGEFTIQFNVRNNPSTPLEKVVAMVEGLLKKHGLSPSIAWDDSARPFLTENPQLQEALGRSIAAVVGKPGRPSTSGGSSDARFFALAGIPVIEFGPLNATIHAANENIPVADLELLSAIYHRFLGNYLETAVDSAERRVKLNPTS